MAAVTRLTPDGYGGRRAGSFAGKAGTGVTFPAIITAVDALAGALAASASDRALAGSDARAGGGTASNARRSISAGDARVGTITKTDGPT